MQVSNETLQEVIINLHVGDSEVTGSVTHPATLDVGLGLGIPNNMVVGTHPGEQVPPAVVKVTAGERAQGLIRGLQLVLQLFSIPKGAMDSFKTQATEYLTVESELVFFKRAKYLTVAPMARYLRCEAPKTPDLAWKPIGQYRNWANTRLRVFNRTNTHMWYSFLQGKRSALPLSDELVLTTYEEHRKAMEIGDPIDNETHDSVMKELKPVLDKVRALLRKTYDTCGRDNDWLSPGETQHVASTRASEEKSRAAGGQLGALMRHVPHLYECNPLNTVNKRKNPDLIRMVFYPRVIVGGRVQLNVVIEEYGYPLGEKEWYSAIRKSCVYFAKEQRTLKATIQAVLEPLKVRVISKGNADPYYVSKRLQKALHDVLRDFDCFRLIGAPLGATDLLDLALNPVLVGTGQLEWFSIDYSAATDRLSARLSASILGELIQGQDPAMQNIWKAVLAPHFCKYPFPYDTAVPPVQQRNGQLMGSILSFPILCLANLGLYLETIKEDSRRVWEKLKGVLVNGDDMLYVAPRSLWEKHIAVGEKVGLTMSPGKAYHHPVYANANSACYHFDLRRLKTKNISLLRDARRVKGLMTPVYENVRVLDSRSSTPYSIPFLNSGLYFGQNKVLGGDEIENEKSYSSVINRLIEGAPAGKAADLLKMYINRHSKALKEECAGRNLFLPISLGGMGVNLVDGFNFTTTVGQRAYAHLKLTEDTFLTSDPFPWTEEQSRKIPEAPQILRAPWLAGLTFVQNSDGKYEVGTVGEETPWTVARRIQSLDRSFHARGDHKKPILAHMKQLQNPLRICSMRRKYVPYVHRPPISNPFEVRSRRDWLLHSVAEGFDSLELVVPIC